MKSILNVVIASLSLASFNLMASECKFNEVASNKKVFVIPLYKATVNFVVDKVKGKSIARVQWGLDEAKTTECYEHTKGQFPGHTVIIPTVRMDRLTVSFLKGSQSVPMEVFPQANGHFFGSATLTDLPLSSKEEIEQLMQEREHVIAIEGDLRYRMSLIERGVVEQLECTQGPTLSGVLAMYQRLGEIKAQIEKRNPKESVNAEEVLQDFLGNCVKFTPVESKSLSDFENKVRLSSKLIKGKVNVYGNVSKIASESMPTISIQSVSIIEL